MKTCCIPCITLCDIITRSNGQGHSCISISPRFGSNNNTNEGYDTYPWQTSDRHPGFLLHNFPNLDPEVMSSQNQNGDWPHDHKVQMPCTSLHHPHQLLAVSHNAEYIENIVCTRVMNCFSTRERVILSLFPELRSIDGNKHKTPQRGK